MRDFEIWAGDSFEAIVKVVDPDRESVDLTGSTLEVNALSPKGVAIDATSILVTDAAAGLARLTFSSGLFSFGDWRMQVRRTSSASVSTVAEHVLRVK